eukprot:740594-Pyramimonas_sp.AAC.1
MAAHQNPGEGLNKGLTVVRSDAVRAGIFSRRTNRTRACHLDVALDDAAQQVQAEEREGRGAEEAEHAVELDEEVVQKGAGGRVDEHVQYDVQDPADGDNSAQDAERALQVVEYHGEDPRVLGVLPLSQSVSQSFSQLASQPVSQPVSHPVSQSASQSASKPASQAVGE